MATKFWKGGAVPVRETWEIAVGGTWAASDTAWVEVNGKRLTLTVDGARLTVADICADVTDMINGDAVNGAETRSAIGTDVGEWAILQAGDGGNKVYIYGPTDGRPCGTITAGETSTLGTFTVGGSPTIAGSGPYDWDTADNWSDGSVPGASDIVIFDYRASYSCLYNLSQGSLSLGALYVEPSYQRSLGLPAINTDIPNKQFPEHLTQYLTLSACSNVYINAAAAGSIKIDTGSSACTAVVYSTGVSDDTAFPPCMLKMNHASSELHVTGGQVGICYEIGVSGTVAAITCSGDLGAVLYVGAMSTIPSFKIVNGICEVSATVTTLDMSGGIYRQLDGSITTGNVNGGTLEFSSADGATTFNMSGGSLDFRKDSRDKTVTNLNLYAPCTVRDPIGAVTITNGLDVYGHIDDYILDMPARKTWTLSTI